MSDLYQICPDPWHQMKVYAWQRDPRFCPTCLDSEGITTYVPVEPVAEMEVFDGDWVATVPVLPDGRYAIVKIGEADDE